MNDFTEMYSALCAEVPMEDDPKTSLNRELLEELKSQTKVNYRQY